MVFWLDQFQRQRAQGSPSSSAPSIVPTANGIQQLLAAFPNSPAGPIYQAIGPTSVAGGNPSFSDLQMVDVSDGVTTAPIEFGTITRFVASPFNDYEGTGRIDVKLTSKDNFFGRYVFQQAINDGINFGLGTDVGDWQQIPSLVI